MPRSAAPAVPAGFVAATAVATPRYWDDACRHLARRDRVMKKLIPRFGQANGYCLMIGGEAAAVQRLATPEMRAAGLSARKCEYLRDLARHFAERQAPEADWLTMDDEAIITELVAIRGIGRWTAEMFLIFHLMRPNVMPLDDLGLLKGISECYFSGEPVSRAEARELGEGWAPYRSVATWYLWRSLDPLPVEY